MARPHLKYWISCVEAFLTWGGDPIMSIIFVAQIYQDDSCQRQVSSEVSSLSVELQASSNLKVIKNSHWILILTPQPSSILQATEFSWTIRENSILRRCFLTQNSNKSQAEWEADEMWLEYTEYANHVNGFRNICIAGVCQGLGFNPWMCGVWKTKV